MKARPGKVRRAFLAFFMPPCLLQQMPVICNVYSRGSLIPFLDDSFPAHWVACNSNFWSHGRHWPANLRLCLAGGFRSAARAIHKKRLLKEGGGETTHRDEGFFIIGIAGLAGIVGARLYHVLETPRELMADPSMLISRFGFAWFGGFLGGFVALVFLAGRFGIPMLNLWTYARRRRQSVTPLAESAACCLATVIMAFRRRCPGA